MSAKILILLDDPQLPSSRVSALQYVDLMRESGFEVDVAAMKPRELAAARDRSSRYLRRLRLRAAAEAAELRVTTRHEEDILRRAETADVVYVVKVPELAFLRRLAGLRRPKILFHVSDAFWLPFLRDHGWGDVAEMLGLADAVTTTNEFTAARVGKLHEKVYVVPDGPQVEDFDRLRRESRRGSGELVVGWIGTPLTAPSLFRIWGPLEQLAAERPDWSLRLVGTGHSGLINVPRFERVRWSRLDWYDQETMIREVLSMDIGVFPMFAGEDSLSRGSLKALLYMSGEAASVSQRYGDNVDVVDDGVTGLLAGDDAEWLQALRRLLEDSTLRSRLAANALEMVRARYSRRAIWPRLQRPLLDLTGP